MKKVLLCIAVLTAFVSCKKETCPKNTSARLEIRIKSLNLPVGCTSTAGYSTVTGTPCSGFVESDIQVSPTSSTMNVPIFSFSMKAVGGSMDIGSIILPYEGPAHLENIISHASVYMGSILVGEINLESGLIAFRGLQIHLEDDLAMDFTVVADILPAIHYPNNTHLKFYLGSNYIDVRSNDGREVSIDIIDVPERPSLRLYTYGIRVEMGTLSYSRTTNTSGEVTSVTYYIPIRISSFGTTLYLGQSLQLASAVSGTNAFALVFQNSNSPTVDDVSSIASTSISSSDAAIDGNGFRLDDGTTKHFKIVVTLITPTAFNCSYWVVVKQCKIFANSALTSGATIVDLLPKDQFRTEYQFISN